MTVFNKKGDPPLSHKERSKLMLMRYANTRATTTHSIGGIEKYKGRRTKPVTLAPMPWSRTAGDCK